MIQLHAHVSLAELSSVFISGVPYRGERVQTSRLTARYSEQLHLPRDAAPPSASPRSKPQQQLSSLFSHCPRSTLHHNMKTPPPVKPPESAGPSRAQNAQPAEPLE
ncbi:hypothetical protein Q7C36_008355 [Tachysurus vachellii]|uniref:Uncharacterized protein n=1 Tax=Tachysurus vachellii TaxID=175792 RepID=A0AA88SWJ5_TACVA|nr:hypothetical protein Q7C36_008355 [Tachysurus vachellii]